MNKKNDKGEASTLRHLVIDCGQLMFFSWAFMAACLLIQHCQ